MATRQRSRIIDWSVVDLSKDSQAIARKLKVSYSAVYRAKVIYGFLPGSSHSWTPAEDALLGTDIDDVIAKRIGRKPWAVGLRRKMLGIRTKLHPRWTEEEDSILGLASDAELAEALGRSESTVRKRRSLLGIRGNPQKEERPNWKRKEDKLLGTAPDRLVAKQIGRTLAEVMVRRVSLGIPAVARTPGKKRLVTSPPVKKVPRSKPR